MVASGFLMFVSVFIGGEAARTGGMSGLDIEDGGVGNGRQPVECAESNLLAVAYADTVAGECTHVVGSVGEQLYLGVDATIVDGGYHLVVFDGGILHHVVDEATLIDS